MDTAHATKKQPGTTININRKRMTKLKRIYFQPMARQIDLATEGALMSFSKEDPKPGDQQATGEDFGEFEEVSGTRKMSTPWSNSPW